MNISLVEALEKILIYATFMKDPTMRKRIEIFMPIDNLDHYRTMVFLTFHKKDPIESIILFNIRAFMFSKCLYDLVSSINLVSIIIFR